MLGRNPINLDISNQDLKSTSLILNSRNKNRQYLGSIYTPQDFSQIIASWAITRGNEKILDIGVGEGSVTFASYDRLLECGASPEEAQNSIYGAEIDPNAFSKFQKLCAAKTLHFPNISFEDFFQISYPRIDVAIGNPPYVRRSKIQNLKQY